MLIRISKYPYVIETFVGKLTSGNLFQQKATVRALQKYFTRTPAEMEYRFT